MKKRTGKDRTSIAASAAHAVISADADTQKSTITAVRFFGEHYSAVFGAEVREVRRGATKRRKLPGGCVLIVGPWRGAT
jgi:hypothetical protein